MDTELINLISTLAFFVVIGALTLISLMAIYVFIRYGQKKSFTTIISMAFAAVFFLGTIAAFVSLRSIF